MEPNKQRQAIADYCKFETVEVDGVICCYVTTEKSTLETDVLEDLNAMHEVWLLGIKHKITPGGEPMQQYWRGYLSMIVRRDFEKVGFQSTSNATAAQRAEAFLRTIGKWEES